MYVAQHQVLCHARYNSGERAPQGRRVATELATVAACVCTSHLPHAGRPTPSPKSSSCTAFHGSLAAYGSSPADDSVFTGSLSSHTPSTVGTGPVSRAQMQAMAVHVTLFYRRAVRSAGFNTTWCVCSDARPFYAPVMGNRVATSLCGRCGSLSSVPSHMRAFPVPRFSVLA